MYRKLLIALLAAPLLSACIVEPRHPGPGPGIVIAPALPLIVELGVEPYYFQSGYYYYYRDNRWIYSNARTGPWYDLPRDRYPREVRYKDRRDGHDRDDRRDRDRD